MVRPHPRCWPCEFDSAFGNLMPAIHNPVGPRAVNEAPDVRLVQRLLNNALAGDSEPLAVDGVAGQKTCAAIAEFQSTANLEPDGRVVPGGATLRKLVELQIAGALGGIDPR